MLSSAPANMHYLRLHFLLHALQSAKTEQIDVEPSLYINVKTYRKPLMNILIMRSRDVVVPPLGQQLQSAYLSRNKEGIGEKLDGEVKAYIRAIRDMGGVVTTTISWRGHC